MRRIDPPQQAATGFSLIEIVTALGLFSISAVSLLALVSVALEGTAASSMESQAIHLASSVFSTLKATPFQTVDCFGTTVDLSSAGADPDDPPLLLYAHFPADAPPLITTRAQPGAPGFSLELRLEPLTIAPATAANASRASLTIRPLHGPQKQAVSFQTVIADL